MGLQPHSRSRTRTAGCLFLNLQVAIHSSCSSWILQVATLSTCTSYHAATVSQCTAHSNPQLMQCTGGQCCISLSICWAVADALYTATLSSTVHLLSALYISCLFFLPVVILINFPVLFLSLRLPCVNVGYSIAHSNPQLMQCC